MGPLHQIPGDLSHKHLFFPVNAQNVPTRIFVQ